jgi:hypothetical protein
MTRLAQNHVILPSIRALAQDRELWAIGNHTWGSLPNVASKLCVLDLAWILLGSPWDLILACESEISAGSLEGIFYDWWKVHLSPAPFKVLICAVRGDLVPTGLPLNLSILSRAIEIGTSRRAGTYLLLGFAYNPIPLRIHHLASEHIYTRIFRHGETLYFQNREVDAVNRCPCRVKFPL